MSIVISIDGVEGSGKTSTIEHIVKQLHGMKKTVKVIKFPFNEQNIDELSNLLRTVMYDESNDIDYNDNLKLSLITCVNLLRYSELLHTDYDVFILDRSIYSTIVYQHIPMDSFDEIDDILGTIQQRYFKNHTVHEFIFTASTSVLVERLSNRKKQNKQNKENHKSLDNINKRFATLSIVGNHNNFRKLKIINTDNVVDQTKFSKDILCICGLL